MSISLKIFRTFAIVAAAGSGSRMGEGMVKVLRPLGGRTVLERAVRPFLSLDIHCVIMASAPHLLDYRALFSESPNAVVVLGGESRFESVSRGLEYLAEHCNPEPQDVVLVHDGARCFASEDLISRVISSAHEHRASIPAIPVTDTIKRITTEKRVIESLDRNALGAVQTPQGFHFSLLHSAYRAAKNSSVTDDAGLVENICSVTVVQGEDTNIKITRPIDMLLAEAILANRRLLSGNKHD